MSFINKLCFSLINGSIKSDIESYEGDFEGAIDVTVSFPGGEISASGYGDIDGGDFALASATVEWNGQTLEVDESSPDAEALNNCISILRKGLYDINESKTNMKMKKKVIKINENTLRQIVAESVKKVLKESSDDYLNTELKEIWMGIQRVGAMHGNRIKDGMRKNGQESLIPKYELLEKLADKMREVMGQMFDEIGSDWGTPKPQSNPTHEKGEFSGFGTDGIRAF